MPKISRYVQGRLDERKENYDSIHAIVADIRNKLGPFVTLIDIMNWPDKEKSAQFDIDEQARLCNERIPIITKQLQNILDKLS